MMMIILLVNLIGLLLIVSRGLPKPYPWKASLLLAIVLLLSGFISPLGRIERGVGFVTLTSSVIIAAFVMRHISDRSSPEITMLQIGKAFTALSVLLALFILADAFRIFPTPDVTVTSGETYELIRRPYLGEHPNVKAGWLLLLSLSSSSLVGILFAQSRGALMGYLAALFRYIPTRFYIHALVTAFIVLTIAALVRPGTFFGRVDIWREGVKVFMAHPLAGSGTGSFTYTPIGRTTTHNAALTIAAENGLIGLAVFVAWLIGIGSLVMRSNHIAKYNLIAFSVQQIVDDQWLHPITAILLGVVIAISLFQLETQ